jgi:hypothetical protein
VTRKKAPEVVIPPAAIGFQSIETIEELVDETVNSLEPDELQKLHDKLVAAQNQLNDQIDVLDRAIQDRQINKSPEEDLIELQKPLMELKDSVDEKLEEIRDRVEDQLWIIIDGEIIDVDSVRDACETCPATLDAGRRDWYVDEDSETAGKRSRAYWKEMAENDPSELTCMVGEDTLVKWALNQYAGPGSTHVRNLEEWLDLWLDTPEEQWASYDSNESDVDFCSEALEEELGFKPTVAYRHN